MKKFNRTQFECRIQDLMNPLTPMSDGDRISPYIIDTVSSRKVMRIEKNITQLIQYQILRTNIIRML